MPGYYRKRGNSYQFIVTYGTDYSGKPKRYVESVPISECRTDSQAGKYLAQFYARVADGSISKSSALTVKALCDAFMDSCSINLKKNTIMSYKTILKRIEPLYKKKASALTKKNVQDWVNNYLIEQRKLSPKTINNTLSVLHCIYEWGIEMDLVTSNPCNYIRTPKKKKKEIKSYTEDQLAVLLDAIYNLPDEEQVYRVALLLAIFGGLRRGEMCGLDVNHVGINGVMIEQTRNVDETGVFIDSPKNVTSVRFVTLPEEVMNQIQALIKRQASLESYYEHHSPALLRNSVGNPIRPTWLTVKTSEIEKAAGLPPLGLHALRHTHASMLVSMNSDVSKVSRRLGHSQVTTTLNIYTHLFQQDEAELAAEMNSKFLTDKNKNVDRMLTEQKSKKAAR